MSLVKETYFNAPLFDRELAEITVDIEQTPFFLNDHGHPKYLASLGAGIHLITESATNAKVMMGNAYEVPSEISTKYTKWGEQTELEFEGQYFEFMPLVATKETAAAFGITLVQTGEAIQIHSNQKVLSEIHYEYGMMAGHCFAYLDGGKPDCSGKTLFPFVATDLEHHDFPHIFSSTDQDQLPLVISVGRYFPNLGKIYLADLWVNPGDVLYIPAKPKYSNPEFIDLHNNRNAALACWRGDSNKSTLTTHSLLDTHGHFYWYWNRKPTIHPLIYAATSKNE
ncbi:hypothetical protein B9T33_08485 [Acinetobacter sp. ANC 5054]|uniref:hypothetical protein n=1 Tax=Acinetobacter sp. ANC 5054 TaxID=1977877 RepID=UPI000A33190E|nr:hypothetical protein [Acinetobacter sp. ANC 5054]OTG80458.1 hypothetical protein B9T33_08485 [Acinetobacter sp. ANC 5054]